MMINSNWVEQVPDGLVINVLLILNKQMACIWGVAQEQIGRLNILLRIWVGVLGGWIFVDSAQTNRLHFQRSTRTNWDAGHFVDSAQTNDLHLCRSTRANREAGYFVDSAQTNCLHFQRSTRTNWEAGHFVDSAQTNCLHLGRSTRTNGKAGYFVKHLGKCFACFEQINCKHLQRNTRTNWEAGYFDLTDLDSSIQLGHYLL